MSYRLSMDSFALHLIRQSSTHPCYLIQSPQPSAVPDSPVSALWQPWVVLQAPGPRNSPGTNANKTKVSTSSEQGPLLAHPWHAWTTQHD